MLPIPRMTVGHRLADARRKLGLSPDALAVRTGLSIEVVRAIEETDLARLPSGASLEPAIRAYAAAVHVDAETTGERYLAGLPILVDTADALTAFEPEAKVARPRASSFFTYEPASHAGVGEAPAPRIADVASPALLLHADPDPAGSLSFRAPLEEGTPNTLRLASGRPHRVGLGPLVLLFALAVFGGYLLIAQGDWWRLARSTRSARFAADGAQARQPDASVTHAIAPNTSSSLPTPAANAVPAAVAEPSESVTPHDSKKTPVGSNEAVGKKAQEQTLPARSPRAAVSDDPPVPSAVIIVPGSPPASALPATSAPPDAGELSGSWTVIVHDEASTPEADRNKIAFYLRLEQRGTQVEGSGYRVSEATAEAPSSQQSVVALGTLSGDRLTLTLNGQNRERFVLLRSDHGAFRGRFRRDGAPENGSSLVTLSPRGPSR